VIAIYAAVAVLATGNWWSRYAGQRVVEHVTKPAFTALVVVGALGATPHSTAMRAWFVVAFVLCLAGDVFLMLRDEFFIAGLTSFLLGHVAFVVGLVVNGRGWHVGVGSVAGLLLVAAIAIVAGPRIVAGAQQRDRALAGPVVAYLGVITTMAVVAAWKGNGWAIGGASAFVVSDALLGWGRFVRAHRHGEVAVMVTYHAALVGLLLSLH
jgi:uncharacterized membrane protein YhhN